jgi:predicted amidohydrolase YtcJ
MDDSAPAYRRAVERGQLTADVVDALWWDRTRGVEQVAELVVRRESCSAGRFRATSVKVMQDGVVENGSAALGAPYLDRAGRTTAGTGHSNLTPDALRAAVAALAGAGFQVHVHAIGDRGVRESLDASERAPAGSDLRHHVAHVQLVHPDDAGVLRRGAVADLVVLDRDPFAGPADGIGACRVTSTWVAGVPVHEA